MKLIVYPSGLIEDETGTAIYQSSVSQQHAREVLHETIVQQGMTLVEEWEMDDYSIEVTVG